MLPKTELDVNDYMWLQPVSQSSECPSCYSSDVEMVLCDDVMRVGRSYGLVSVVRTYTWICNRCGGFWCNAVVGVE